MVDLEVAKEIVEKLNSGKSGLLSLAREYGIPPKEIVELPEFVREKEKENKIKEKFELDQRKELLIAEIEHKIFLLKEALNEDKWSDFAKYCKGYIRAFEDIEKKIKKCENMEELNVLKDLVYTYFLNIEIKDGEVVRLSNPEVIFEEWIEE